MTTPAELYSALKYRVEVSPITGTRMYYNSAGQLHREDGPAIEYANSNKEWWQNDQRHRTDGPAMTHTDGFSAWFQNGLRHRTVGPAVEHADGIKEWWLHGVEYTQREYYTQLKALGHTV